MKYKKQLSLLLALMMTFSLTAPALAAEGNLLIAPAPSTNEEVVILYTNDIHTYINKDLTYSKVAALKDSYENVLLVDAGDHIQGTAYGSMDKGETILKLMNAADYDAATLGNHEFDYNMSGCMQTIEWAEFPYISCNFYHETNGVPGENILDSYKVFEINGIRIAFVGITTPETFTKTTPAYFQDENGNYIYGIAGGTDGSELYVAVQTAIDDASKEADIVIALGHLGDDPASDPWNSEDVIANTTGLDAFIDGHSHSTIPMKEVTAKDGSTVILTQTGEYLTAVGKMTISTNGTITTELLTADDLADIAPNAEVKAIEDAWIAELDTRLGEVIGYTDDVLNNYDADGIRLARSRETNSGDFSADALYYLFDSIGLDVDFAVMNGGGIRNQALTGELSYLSCKEIHTFGNVACMLTVTGQQMLDALEWSYRHAGYSEDGSFLHVSGLKLTIDTAIPSTVTADEKDVWLSGPTGEYRVKDVMVWNKESGAYEPLDPEAEYNLAGYNYTLRDLGGGFAMFDGAVNVLDYVMEDYMVLAEYIKSFPIDEETGLPVVSGYDNVYGDGRITILTESAEEPDEEVEKADEPAVSTAETYVVMPGDCLWSIAAKTLGCGTQWSAIYEANKDIIQNASLIYAGQILTIPNN